MVQRGSGLYTKKVHCVPCSEELHHSFDSLLYAFYTYFYTRTFKTSGHVGAPGLWKDARSRTQWAMKWSSLARWALWAVTVLALGAPCSCEWLIQQPMCCWLFFHSLHFYPHPLLRMTDYSLLPLQLPYSLLACPLPSHSLPVSSCIKPILASLLYL